MKKEIADQLSRLRYCSNYAILCRAFLESSNWKLSKPNAVPTMETNHSLKETSITFY